MAWAMLMVAAVFEVMFAVSMKYAEGFTRPLPTVVTVLAVIGPQTAKTAEEHGLRVDVLAPSPDVDLLVDALADFGAARRLSMLESGQPVTKPSERKPTARRRASSSR